MLLKSVFCCIIFLIGGVMQNTQITTLPDYFQQAEKISVFNNGQQIVFEKDTTKFLTLVEALQQTTNSAHDMPAFSVSLDSETRQELNNGIWLELSFSNTNSFNELPFDALLFKLQAEDCGMNVIRKHNGKYEGRCFYLNLQNNCETLYQLLKDLFN